MLRRVAAALVLGSLLVGACGNDGDGAGDTTGIDGGDPKTDAAATSTDADTQGDSRTASDADADADAGAGAGADAGTDADASEGTDAEAGTNPLPDAGPGDPGGFCQKFMDGSYSGITTCCAADSDAPAFQFVASFGAYIVPQCSSRIAQSVANGRVAYDPAKEASCLSAITTTAAQCPAIGPVAPKSSPDCELAYRGVVPEGGQCDGDIECANGLPCQGTICKKATTVPGGACAFPDGDADPGIFPERQRCVAGEECFGNGVCGAPAQEGDDCFFDDDCAEGLYCAGPFATSTCQKIVLQDAGGPCVSDDFCKDGLTCHTEPGYDGTCVARKTAGSSCTDQTVNGTECLGYCKGATDDAPGTCHTFCGSQ